MNPDNDSLERRKVVREAEIIGPDEGDSQDFGQAGSSGFRRTVFAYSPVDSSGCLPGCITFALFLVCLGQFGILAGIGFMFFYGAGAILGALRAARAVMAGYPPNPWGWRLGNWLVSFLLTAWLAGGFNQ